MATSRWSGRWSVASAQLYSEYVAVLLVMEVRHRNNIENLVNFEKIKYPMQTDGRKSRQKANNINYVAYLYI